MGTLVLELCILKRGGREVNTREFWKRIKRSCEPGCRRIFRPLLSRTKHALRITCPQKLVRVGASRSGEILVSLRWMCDEWHGEVYVKLRRDSLRKRMTNRICGAPLEFTSAGSERDFLVGVGITAGPSSLLQNHV